MTAVLTSRQQVLLLHLCRRHITQNSSEASFALSVIETAAVHKMPTLEALKYCKNYMKAVRESRVVKEQLC